MHYHWFLKFCYWFNLHLYHNYVSHKRLHLKLQNKRDDLHFIFSNIPCLFSLWCICFNMVWFYLIWYGWSCFTLHKTTVQATYKQLFTHHNCKPKLVKVLKNVMTIIIIQFISTVWSLSFQNYIWRPIVSRSLYSQALFRHATYRGCD